MNKRFHIDTSQNKTNEWPVSTWKEAWHYHQGNTNKTHNE